MGWILMQPNKFDASEAALALLQSKGLCNFDLTMNGTHLHSLGMESTLISM